MKLQRNRHFWEYMGRDTETNAEYSQCAWCRKFREGGKIVPARKYRERVKAGKVVIE